MSAGIRINLSFDSRDSLNWCTIASGLLILILLYTPVSGDMNLEIIPENQTTLSGVFAPVNYHMNEMEITRESVGTFIDATGGVPSIVAFSHEWSVNRSFPHKQVSIIRSIGSIPYIRLMMRSSVHHYRPEPVFTLKRIRDGFYDKELRTFARHARDLDTPIIIEYGTEVNGWWFSWNGYWTGKDQGAELFKRVYRHIIDIMREEGADNLIWVYHINWNSVPDEPWNQPSAYYPGDEYIDIIGVSAYGALLPDSRDIKPFSYMMDMGYAAAKYIAPDKPVIIAEIGTDLNNPHHSPVNWTERALFNIIDENRWPDVFGFIWWNAAWPNQLSDNTSMRIEKDPGMREVFQKYIS